MYKLRNKFLQNVGNYILNKMSKCPKYEIEAWYDRGLWFNDFCILEFNLYLE